MGDDALASRRQALESWAQEPIALESTTCRFLLDRRDSSFWLQSRRTGVRFYSSWSHRGFAVVRLAKGGEFPLDQVEGLHAESARVRFTARSSLGDVPAVRFEIRAARDDGSISIRYEIPPDARDSIVSLRLLSDALWLSDADGGAAFVVSDSERALRPSPELDDPSRELHLLGYPTTRGGLDMPGAYALPVVGILRQSAPLLVYWEDPRLALRIVDRRVEDERFPGRRGVFVTLESNWYEGEVLLRTVERVERGALEIAGGYREALLAEGRLPSLRKKTSHSEACRSLLGAAVFKARIAQSGEQKDLGYGGARHSFDALAALAKRLRDKLELDQALWVVDEWIDGRSSLKSNTWAAVRAAGGTEGLQSLRRQLSACGYLLGLGIERAALHVPLVTTPTKTPRCDIWKRSLEFARTDNGFTLVDELYSPDLVILRETLQDASLREAARDPEELLEVRSELAEQALENFGMVGFGRGSLPDLRTAAYLEAELDFSRSASSTELQSMNDAETFPFFASIAGASTRLVMPSAGLGPLDAEAFLRHLTLGEVPVYDVATLLSRSGGDTQPSLAAAGACFARAAGWSQGQDLNAAEVFLKNTFEVATHVARLRGRTPLSMFRRRTEDGRVQESWFGTDLRVIVNHGPEEWFDEETGTRLPQFGFLIRHPFFRAFHATEAGGLKYDEPALFTVLSLEGKLFLRAEQVRLWRGFGPRKIRLGGKTFEVDRELITKIW